MVTVLRLTPEDEAKYQTQLAALGPQGVALANLLHFLSTGKPPTEEPAPVYVRQAWMIARMDDRTLATFFTIATMANVETQE
jgi:hypothetical protein